MLDPLAELAVVAELDTLPDVEIVANLVSTIAAVALISTFDMYPEPTKVLAPGGSVMTLFATALIVIGKLPVVLKLLDVFIFPPNVIVLPILLIPVPP